MECVANARPLVKMNITWRKNGVVVSTGIRDFSRRLVIGMPAVSDSGYYECEASLRSSSVPSVSAGAYLHNPVAVLSTSEKRAINLTWAQAFDGNSPLIRYIMEVSENNAPWTVLLANIEPESTGVVVGALIPARSYQFRLCAVNDIEVASYNGAGRGTYSHKVTEWTLQGVPTVPPGNVQAEAVNSTAVRFTWTAPSPQFINGINQGYKLLAWEPSRPNEVTVVLVRPNFQDSVHVGYISGLKKFTDYYSSVLCFTTPGDGPRSPPQRIRTHEDTPGAVGHLSFTDILDTSLKVSWEEPLEKNGFLTGYRISWEEFNRTNTRVTHYLPNLTQEYRVTGLTALTTYTIQVAAMTSKGQGQLSASTISSGVPPELPGPPTNLAISDISPRSVNLQFKPGYDGKTSISRWLVEAQIGIIGENEEWLTVQELANEPDARSLEVFDLNPYTFYRFRMRQVNIVGTSPPSQPSRKIQTLQAPPDISPANVTLRTASETSLWLRWVPLPEWEYNGNPDLVGYRIQYSKAGSKGSVLSHVIMDRLEREFTVEDLEEWTEYEVRVQAINGIGSGPWSLAVHGRTRESVPSSGPTNVSAFATTSSSILVRWGEVQEADRNGLILGYKVVYKEKDSDTTPNFWAVEGNNTHSVQLSGLGKYVLYEIQVLAFTRIGDGRSSSPHILERTLDDVPGPPVGILFPEVRTTSVRLIWQPPAQPNGIILAYQITYRRNSSSSNAATVDVLSPSARQYTATGLKPETVYVFRLTAQTRKGWGEAAEALVVTTEKRARPQPTSRPTVPQEEVQARRVLLSWEPGSDGLSPVRYYTVQYKELPDSNWTVHSASVSHETNSHIVNRLKPFTSYQFRVKATNDIGDSRYSEESEAITTLQDAPDKAPTILSVTPHTTTSVLVRWQPPSEDHINGVLLGFRVRYRELHYDRLRSFSVRTVNSPSANWADLTAPYSIRNLSESSLTQYELDNLSKHKRYEIRLSVYNAVGEGPSSTPQEVFVGEAVPTAAPQSVVVQSSTATQLDVTWDPPPPDAQNGDIQGYKIYFWEFQLQNETERVSKIVTVDVKGSAPLWMKIKDLADGVTYSFRIRAKTLTYGPEIEANITTGPGEGAPGPPGEPFISRHGTALTLHWTSGDHGRAPITRYVIEARPSDEGLWDILVKDIPKEVTSYTLNLDVLREGVTYDFRVIAVNDYGYGSPSAPSPSISAQKMSPFYEEWWFLVVIALVGLIFILLLIFILIIRGQSKKYTKKADSGNHSSCTALPLTHGEMVRLDEGRFPALELNNRRLSGKNSFCRKNGIYTRSPPRPSPGSLHYSDEDVSTKYNDLIPAESSSLTEKPSEISDSQGSDSEYEVDQSRQKTHSFVNHYISDPTYYNSWRRQQKGVSRPPAYGFSQPEPLVEQESRQHPPPVPPLPPLLPQSSPSPQPQAQGTLFRPKGSRTPTPSLLSSEPPSQHSTLYRPPSSLGCAAQAPTAGFSSFV
uniref:Sidekick cell adhesion molecule 2 n=1 Tax=Nothobranchius korthausae TaxID=1143690 RepID=A0A1A8HEA8_9TELE